MGKGEGHMLAGGCAVEAKAQLFVVVQAATPRGATSVTKATAVHFQTSKAVFMISIELLLRHCIKSEGASLNSTGVKPRELTPEPYPSLGTDIIIKRLALMQRRSRLCLHIILSGTTRRVGGVLLLACGASKPPGC
jgi:hypothetical protein